MKEKILIIDDNKMLSKLLAKKISSSLGCDVDIAYNLSQSKDLIASGNQYFLIFADLCLPDAANGEVVDELLAQNQLIVVLTANNDKKVREQFINKDILAYINKESETCIEQITTCINLLSRYRKNKVILALSKQNERNEIKKLLKLRLFNVLVAAHGEEALGYLEDNADTKLIICDTLMPVMDGLTLLTQVRQKYAKTELAVIVLGDKDDALEAEILRNNANEFLTKPFSKDLFNARLDKSLKYLDDFELMSIFKDLEPLTGAKNSSALKNEIEDYLKEIANSNEEFAFAFMDIDSLRSINDEYGYAVGDLLIKAAVKEALNETKGSDIIGHFSSEKICILLKNITQQNAITLLSNIQENIKNKSILVNIDELYFSVCIGVTFSKADNTPLNKLIFKANEALKSAKAEGRGVFKICP